MLKIDVVIIVVDSYKNEVSLTEYQERINMIIKDL